MQLGYVATRTVCKMPFKSEKQRRFMFSQHPEIAKRWTKKYGSKPMPPYKRKNGVGMSDLVAARMRRKTPLPPSNLMQPPPKANSPVAGKPNIPKMRASALRKMAAKRRA